MAAHRWSMHFSDKERGMSCYLPVAKNVRGETLGKREIKPVYFIFIRRLDYFPYSPIINFANIN